MPMDGRLRRVIEWSKGQDPSAMYVATVDGERWTIRLGEFPDEPLYALAIDGVEVVRFDDWPPLWTRPA